MKPLNLILPILISTSVPLTSTAFANYDTSENPANGAAVSPAPGVGDFTGTVEAVDVGSNAIHISDDKGQVSSVTVTRDTVIRRQDQEVPFSRLKTGDM